MKETRYMKEALYMKGALYMKEALYMKQAVLGPGAGALAVAADISRHAATPPRPPHRHPAGAGVVAGPGRRGPRHARHICTQMTPAPRASVRSSSRPARPSRAPSIGALRQPSGPVHTPAPNRFVNCIQMPARHVTTRYLVRDGK